MPSPFGPKKDMAFIILDKMNNKKEEEPKNSPSLEQDASEMAASALIKALENKNPAAIVKAFKELMEYCDLYSDMED